MKKKEFNDIKLKEKEKIEALLTQKRLELSQIQVKIRAGKEKNLKLGKNIKKDIARLLTLLNLKV